MNKELYSDPRRGICPHCKKVVSRLIAEEVAASPTRDTSAVWRTVAYSCPECNAVLGVQMEPEALRAGIAANIEKLMKEAEARLVTEIKKATLAGQHAGIAVKALEEKLSG